MQVGDVVNVLYPFDDAFPGRYEITLIGTADDGQAIVFLVDIFGAFDPKYLQVS